MFYELPCKKCPVFPICVNKKQVECEILFRSQISHKLIFELAKNVWPKLECICDNNICVSKDWSYARKGIR
jgi:hypothetical protein